VRHPEPVVSDCVHTRGPVDLDPGVLTPKLPGTVTCGMSRTSVNAQITSADECDATDGEHARHAPKTRCSHEIGNAASMYVARYKRRHRPLAIRRRAVRMDMSHSSAWCRVKTQYCLLASSKRRASGPMVSLDDRGEGPALKHAAPTTGPNSPLGCDNESDSDPIGALSALSDTLRSEEFADDGAQGFERSVTTPVANLREVFEGRDRTPGADADDVCRTTEGRVDGTRPLGRASRRPPGRRGSLERRFGLVRAPLLAEE
jgi:hypothetical protein